MSVNRFQPHVLILPEDDADRQLANGFHLRIEWKLQRQMQVLPVAGGWREVLNQFRLEHIHEMRRCPTRMMVLIIDYDGHPERIEEAAAAVPGDLRDRVTILGVLTTPEALKRRLGPYEQIGSMMADECREGTEETWTNQLLRHNENELNRLRDRLCSIFWP